MATAKQLTKEIQQVGELPTCNGCGEPHTGEYDIPSIGGQWGNWCESCVGWCCNEAGMRIGFRRVQNPVQEYSPMILELAEELGMDPSEVAEFC